MAAYETGYGDELFEHPVGHSLHCGICTNVIKDPVACRHNEHLFCRACITEHLKNYQKCPSCMDLLTVDTLSQAPRTVTNLLAELKIRCKFFDRGCGKFIELGNLESHIRECGFAPAVCSNEGCALEVNKQDLLHHETAVCDHRRVTCHSCDDIRREMDIVKVNLATMNVKLASIDENAKQNDEKMGRNQENVKMTVENVVAKVELVQEQLNNLEVNNRLIQEDIVEMKKSLHGITTQLERLTQQTSHEVQAEKEQMKKGIAEAAEMDVEPKIIIAGGHSSWTLNSVEMFSLLNGTWTMLKPMKECRYVTSSVVHSNEMLVVGGFSNNSSLKSIEKLSLNAVQANAAIIWQIFPAVLPELLCGHHTVVYNGRLIVTGGYRSARAACSDSITEISLLPPYTSQRLTTMPQTRRLHGIAIFGDKIVILGGRSSIDCRTNLKTILMYDITKNKCEELAPLPYPVSIMATVKWGDDNVIIMGGVDSNEKPLNTALIYNVYTQKSHMLPDMKYRRRGCVAAVVRDTVIVMGGQDERGLCLKSVECFRFDRYTWEELPEMHEARYGATAVVCLL